MAIEEGLTQTGMGGLQGFAATGDPLGAAIGAGAAFFGGMFGGGAAKAIKAAATKYYLGAVEERKTAEVQSRAFEGTAKLFTIRAEADVINLARHQRAAFSEAGKAVQATQVGLWLLGGLVLVYVLKKMTG